MTTTGRSCPVLCEVSCWVSGHSQLQHSPLNQCSGSAYIFRHKQMQDHHQKHLSSRTDQVISRAHKQWSHEPDHQSAFLNNPGSASHNSLVVDSSPSTSMILSPGGTPRRHVVNHSQNEIRDALHVARHDHMSSADCFVSVDQSAGTFGR